MSRTRTFGRALAARVVVALGAAAVLGPVGCQESADDGIQVDATGTVAGFAWLDRNGNSRIDATDGPAGDVAVQLRTPIGGRVVYTAETGPSGAFVLPDVLVGTYRATVDSSTIGDTLRVLRVDSADITVMPGDTSVVAVGLTYPVATTDSIRVAPDEARLWVEGRVISAWGTFGDATVHVRDSTGAIRAVRVQPTATTAGDSVRLLGAVAIQSGQPVLKDAVVFLLETGVESPAALLVTTLEAATAEGGDLDAELVRVTGGVIQDTARNAFGEPVLTVDDGSGPVDVVLDRDVPFFLNFPPAADVIGTTLDVTGLLIPPATGAQIRWVLKPRDNLDISIR